MDSHTQQMPYWDGPYLRSIVTEHIAGRRNYVQEIHAVLTLEAAERLLLRGTA
jgi:asparagine synthase (glutamine-hydrolysing)